MIQDFPEKATRGCLDVSGIAGPRLGDLSPVEKAEFWVQVAGQVVEALRPACEAIEAYKQGDKKSMWRLAEEYLGLRPDPKFKSFLDATIKDMLEMLGIEYRDLPIYLLYEKFEEKGIRLARDDEVKRIPERNREVRRKIKLYESIDKALDVLAVEGQSHEEALLDRLPGLFYEDPRPGYAANEIRREAFERTKKFTVSPTDEVPEDLGSDPELDAVSDRHQVRRALDGAGLSAQERESLVFGEILGNKEAAKHLGRSPSQVSVERSRGKKKVPKSA